jgi:hypothetical protein
MSGFFSWLLGGIVSAFDALFAFMVNLVGAVVLVLADVLIAVIKVLLAMFPDMPDYGSPAALVLVGADEYIPIAQISIGIGLYVAFYQLLGSVAVVKFIRGS